MKYKIRYDLTLQFEGRRLYRIEALKDFKDIKKGDLGGWVEKEYNLSQLGDCWIYPDAKAFENSWIGDNASIGGDSEIGGNVSIGDNAEIGGHVSIGDNASIGGNAEIGGHVSIGDNASIGGNAEIKSNSDLYVLQMSGRSLTFCRDKKIGVNVSIGCQVAISLDSFRERIYSDGNYTDETLPQHRREYLEVINFVKKMWRINQNML